MIEAGLEFHGEIDHVAAALTALPPPLRPTHFSLEETFENDADRTGDKERFTAFVANSESGFFLLGQLVMYSIRAAAGGRLACDCFIDVAPEDAKRLLVEMSKARPLFGYACESSELHSRNRVTIRQGANSIESWVGRDTRKYVPGFYWLTLLPGSLAKQHEVPLSAVVAVALEHIELEGGQHLFQFYERPEEWRTSDAVTQLCASLPGVFDVERVKPQFLTATNYLELSSMLRAWK